MKQHFEYGEIAAANRLRRNALERVGLDGVHRLPEHEPEVDSAGLHISRRSLLSCLSVHRKEHSTTSSRCQDTLCRTIILGPASGWPIAPKFRQRAGFRSARREHVRDWL